MVIDDGPVVVLDERRSVPHQNTLALDMDMDLDMEPGCDSMACTAKDCRRVDPERAMSWDGEKECDEFGSDVIKHDAFSEA